MIDELNNKQVLQQNEIRINICFFTSTITFNIYEKYIKHFMKHNCL